MACPTREIEFRLIPGFEQGYRVGDDGSVWSRLNNRWGLLREWTRLRPAPAGANPHLKVTLCINGKHFQKYVHSLVLLAFVGPCPTGMECLHDDGDPYNNRLDNLAWGTHADNVADMLRHGTHFTPFAKPPKLSKPEVEKIRLLAKSGKSTRAIAKIYGVSKSTVWLIVARRGCYEEK